MNKFSNKHIIITGGSSGIGKATAILLARKGANISIIARTQTTLDTAQTEIQAACVNDNQKVLTFSADVSDNEALNAVLEKAIAQNGVPIVLITSAGIAHPDYFEKLPLEVFEQSMQINYFGTLYAIKAVLPTLTKGSQVVLISSGAGLIGLYGYTPYSPTKFALRGLAESLRGELKPKGIGVAIVYPPDTDTPQLQAENKTKPAETKLITGTAKMWSAEAVAQTIVEGIERNKFMITPGLEMTLLARLHSLLLPILNWYFDRLVAKVKGHH